MKFLDYSGLQRFLDRLKAIIPTKTSDIQNDSGYLNTQGVQNYMENGGGGYSQSYIDTALSGKADSSHTHVTADVTDFPTLATVATSGSYNDLSNTPTIPTVNNKTLTIQKNGTTVNTFTANSASDVTANITVPTAVSELTNDSGYLTSASSLDSSKLTGTIDIARLPKGALERLVTVASQTARFALTTSDVQLGDTVKQLDTGVMYIVTDESKLSSADGYTEYTAGSATSVPWSGVTGKPSDYTPSSHTHGNVTNDGKLPTASRALISDSSKNITVSSVTDTELGYLSGVTSSVQTQLNGKAASNHVHGNITNDGKVGTTANVPLITGTGGVVQAGSFGNAANTFCEGNDSRLSDARTPVAHTHLTSDVTDLLNGNHTWTGDNTFSKVISIQKTTGNFLELNNTEIELGEIPSTTEYSKFGFSDKNGADFSYLRQYYETDGTNKFDIFVRNKFTSGTLDTSGTIDYAHFSLRLNADQTKEGVLRGTFRPYDSNTYDLGSSTYQWNNLYAKNYFYNGTQWGLDRANTWTAQNSFNSDLNLNYASTDVDDIVNSVAGSAVLDNFVHMTGNETVNGIKSFPDGVVANVTGSATSATNDGSGNVISTTYGKLGAENVWTSNNRFNGILPNSGSSYNIGSASIHWLCLFTDSVETYSYFKLTGDRSAYIVPMWAGVGSGISFLTADATKGFYFGNYTADANNKFVIDNTKAHLRITTGETDSKNIAEIAPINATVSNLGTSSNQWKTLNGINPGALSLPSASYIDISGSITDRNFGANYYTAPSDGYVVIGSMASGLQASNDTLGFGTTGGTGQDGYSSVYIPVRTGDIVRILLNQTSTDYQTFRFYSCLGNV